MLELEEAQARILATIPILPTESIRAQAPVAAGRIFAEPLAAPIDLPCFDNSAMDGYAVQARDLENASKAAPIRLRLGGNIPAGDTLAGRVERGVCIRIFTGSVLPEGSDAVVMQEDTQALPGGEVLFHESVKPWENVRLRGEDVKKGERLFQTGDRVTIGSIGLLAALGLTEIRVREQPMIGFLSTGNELLEPGQPLAPGKIYESNRGTLQALAMRAGATTKSFPLVRDDLLATRHALEMAATECDAVITTGGVSVGEHDLVKAAFSEMGGELEFWKVAIRPGKPFLFGRWQEKFLFGLPGNPVSALVTFLLLVRPAIRRWQGASQVWLPATTGTLAEAFVNQGDRRHFMRVATDQAGMVRSAGTQASHALSSFARANGLLDVPRQSKLEAGAIVPVLRWED